MTWLEETQRTLARVVGELANQVPDAARDVALEVIVEELKKIPFVGSLLAKTVETLGANEPEASIEDVLDRLSSLAASTDDLSRYLESMGESLETMSASVDRCLDEMRVLRNAEEPSLRLVMPRLLLHHPIDDNELRAGLANVGGGAVMVSEIELHVESHEPVTEVDFSVPAAPMQMLFLKVRLSPDRRHYPLLELNHQPWRTLGPRMQGAEQLTIQMSSTTNALYRIRIAVVHDGGGESRLVHPEAGAEPLAVPFCFAPGWVEMDAGGLLDRPALLEKMEERFGRLASLLTDHGERLPDDGLRDGVVDLGFTGAEHLVSTVRAFLHPAMRIGALEGDPKIGAVLLRAAWGARHFAFEGPEALTVLLGGAERAKRLADAMKSASPADAELVAIAQGAVSLG